MGPENFYLLRLGCQVAGSPPSALMKTPTPELVWEA